jgi:hypothetical protein
MSGRVEGGGARGIDGVGRVEEEADGAQAGADAPAAPGAGPRTAVRPRSSGFGGGLLEAALHSQAGGLGEMSSAATVSAAVPQHAAAPKGGKKAANNATSLDDVKDYERIDWTKVKPTKADKDLVKELSKLSKKDLEERVEGMDSKTRYLIQNLIGVVEGHESKLTVRFAEAVGASPATDATERRQEAELTIEFIARKLAKMSDAELKAWYDRASPEDKKVLRSRIYWEADRLTAAERKDVEKLVGRLNQLYDEDAGAWAIDHYAGMSDAELREAVVNRKPVEQLVEDLRLVAQSGSPKARELEKRLMAALLHEAKRQQGTPPHTYDTLSLISVADAAAKLEGQGAAAVKGQLIGLLHDRYGKSKDGVPVGLLMDLLKSDPGGVIAYLEEYEDRDPSRKGLLQKSLTRIAEVRGKKDPQGAADALAEILGGAAGELAKAAAKKPLDAEAMARLESLAYSFGYALRAAEAAIEKLGDDAKKKIDHGAFILSIFTKGVSKLSGIPGIDKIGKEIIGRLANAEKKDVDKWVEKLSEELKVLIDGALRAGGPAGGSGSKGAEAYRDAANLVEDNLQGGYNEHKTKVEKKK